MVRSRSQTNLNRIFVDLCTSPEVRHKHEHQANYLRQYHPPLPSLQPIKSNSCSNITDLVENLMESTSSIASDQIEQRETINFSSLQPPASSAIPLVPMESTGFVVQPTNSISTNRSLKLFETLSINHTKQLTSNEQIPKDNTKTKPVPLTSNPSNSLQDWKHQDFTNRLQNRLKSRGHLRKFFLS